MTAQEGTQDASSAPVVSADVQPDSKPQKPAQPQRIQRKRTKGWRMPEGAKYVGRPSRWGNPFRIYDRLREWLKPLVGRDLACWCPLDQPCHADVLLRVANGGAS